MTPARSLEQAIPQDPLGLDVECAGEVVEHHHLGVAHEHPGRRRALHLAAGEADAQGPDHRVESLGHVVEIGFHHGTADGDLEALLQVGWRPISRLSFSDIENSLGTCGV